MHFEHSSQTYPTVMFTFHGGGGCVIFGRFPRAASTYRVDFGERRTQCGRADVLYTAAVEPTAMVQNSAIESAFVLARLGASRLVELSDVQQFQDNRRGVLTRPGRSSQVSTNHTIGQAMPLSLMPATLSQHG